MRHTKFKQFIMLFGFVISTTVGIANGLNQFGSPSVITIKNRVVQGIPKGSSIQATIDGHTLSVVFLEDLGQVAIEITDDGGGDVETTSLNTPNGIGFYIPLTGSYIITFTLPNGDEYYGEFEVTD